MSVLLLDVDHDRRHLCELRLATIPVEALNVVDGVEST